MDTEWFALDEDGHIGCFETGEDGALSTGAATGFGPDDPSFDTTMLEALRIARCLESGQDLAGDWRTPTTAGQTLIVVDPETAQGAREIIGDCVQADRLAVINNRSLGG